MNPKHLILFRNGNQNAYNDAINVNSIVKINIHFKTYLYDIYNDNILKRYKLNAYLPSSSLLNMIIKIKVQIFQTL